MAVSTVARPGRAAVSTVANTPKRAKEGQPEENTVASIPRVGRPERAVASMQVSTLKVARVVKDAEIDASEFVIVAPGNPFQQ